jgi:Kef-type K+ transport system membrane component KefB
MDHPDISHFLGMLVVMLVAAKVFGVLAQRIGQPSVLGELIAGVVLGGSVLGLVDSKDEVLHVFARLGVIILLFEIGLETDLAKLLKVGGTSATVALVGVVLPFVLGFGVCKLLRLENLEAVVAGATLTATSVGITARVLTDLNRLQEPESQIILGAAVIDDVLGLVILAVVAGLAEGQEITVLGTAKITALSFGFLIVTLLVGRLIVPGIVRRLAEQRVSGMPTLIALVSALGLGWLAEHAGSEVIIGAFAAGLLLRETSLAHEMEKGVRHLGHFFVPLFFLGVGAEVDVRVLNPSDSSNWHTLLIGGLLIVAAVAGKFAAGYAPYWFKGNKNVIGVGMIPRGEVGLIFAQMGLSTGIFDAGVFSAVTLMVLATTFMAPPLLKMLFPARSGKGEPVGGVSELVNEA